MIVFNPELGCIIGGYVHSVSLEKGIRITMGFMSDIYVAPDLCPVVSE
jgi:DNA-directed RNA polymerase subunit E'/Rpb7